MLTPIFKLPPHSMSTPEIVSSKIFITSLSSVVSGSYIFILLPMQMSPVALTPPCILSDAVLMVHTTSSSTSALSCVLWSELIFTPILRFPWTSIFFFSQGRDFNLCCFSIRFIIAVPVWQMDERHNITSHLYRRKSSMYTIDQLCDL